MAKVPDIVNNNDVGYPPIGHLPEWKANAGKQGSQRPSGSIYNELLMRRWHEILNSSAPKKESALHEFFESHPSLLPGAYSVDGDSGHSPYPTAVISKPKLPGISDREPDFMWIASDSTTVYPVLIEIETPHKRWFYGDRAEIHSDFTHAQGQLAEWRAWFNRPANRSAFLEYYEIPSHISIRTISPRFVLVYGRKEEGPGATRRLQKRAELARQDERLMSFDRLSPAKNSVLFSCVSKTQDGYQAKSVPPCFTIINNGYLYSCISGWEWAIENCFDMQPVRREYLKNELHSLLRNPDRDVAERDNGLRTRTPKWL